MLLDSRNLSLKIRFFCQIAGTTKNRTLFLLITPWSCLIVENCWAEKFDYSGLKTTLKSTFVSKFTWRLVNLQVSKWDFFYKHIFSVKFSPIDFWKILQNCLLKIDSEIVPEIIPKLLSKIDLKIFPKIDSKIDSIFVPEVVFKIVLNIAPSFFLIK